MATPQHHPADNPRLLWNPDNVRDVAESVGVGILNEEALRVLTQDVEYRIGQVLAESLRMMRSGRRTTLTTQDVSTALRALGVEPLYGYDSTRPLRYGEASLGPGQPLFYLDDEEVDFEKLINAPLPKVPRDTSFTAHWLAIEGVQPSIPHNPASSNEPRAPELVPKGPGANPALAALAGHDNATMKPLVKHILSKELILYFDKVQAALLDENPDEEVVRLRQAALASVRDDPGLHQLVPYIISLITDQVTHRLDDTFVLRRMMELTAALIDNRSLFLDPYASPILAPVLTCLLARRVGPGPSSDPAGGGHEDGGRNSGDAALREQYQLREYSAALVGKLSDRYAHSNALLRQKLTRTCLRYFLDPTQPTAAAYGGIMGLAAAGGLEGVRALIPKTLRSVDAAILQPLRERAHGGGSRSSSSAVDLEMLVGGIVQALATLVEAPARDGGRRPMVNGVNGTTPPVSSEEAAELVDFIGPILADRLVELGNKKLVRQVLDARHIE